MHYYKLVGNNGHGDTYYCQARDINDAREMFGLNPFCESGATGYRISMKEYDATRAGYGIHII